MVVEEVQMKKKNWKDPETPNSWKEQNLKDIQNRMNGWQLDSFLESYNYKTKNGISLIKKKKIDEQK